MIRPEIRRARSSDHAAIDSILHQAFPTTAEANLVKALRAEGAILCELVHERAGVVDGYVVASAMQAPPGSAGLGPVAVSPSAQGKGCGSDLIQAALAALCGGVRAVFVLGEPAFYRRFGFTLEAARPFITPYPKDFMMALELAPGTLAGLSGPLRYARPFEALV